MKIMTIAHRGSSAEAPENTLPAFEKAIELGADYIEMDLHLSSDGIPIVIHDRTINRTTNKKRAIPISDLTLSELKRLDAGAWFAPEFANTPIPTLAEVMTLPRQNVGLMLELKSNTKNQSNFVNSVLKEIPSNSTSIILGSFNLAIIEEIKTANPKFPLIGIADKLDIIAEWQKLGIHHLALDEKLLSIALMEKLHASKILVWAFTVDSPLRAEDLIREGVEGIITNHPRKIKMLTQKYNEATNQ